MGQDREVISKPALEARLDGEVERNLLRAEVNDTARPIVVTPLREPDEDGCNWTVAFVQGGEVVDSIMSAIDTLRERYNIE